MTPRKQRSLTREEVVETALQIVDDEGLEALSMRRLGAALGVEAMALYRHVPNKETLLDLVVDRMRSEAHVAEPHADDPAELMAAIFVEYRRVLAAHPNLVPLAIRRTGTGTPAGLEFLINSGLDPDQAVELYQSLLAFTFGFSLLAAEESMAEDADQQIDRLGRWGDDTYRRTLGLILTGYVKGAVR